MFRKASIATFTALVLVAANTVSAADYVIDGAHSSVKFKISHLGYSWLYGSFNKFSGNFSYDENNPSKSKASVEIDTGSVSTNHAERDKHLRSDDFLHTAKYPKASFVSTGFEEQGNGRALLKGNLSLHGMTKPITIDVTQVGAGKDPWGNYRRGFEGITKLTLRDWGITRDLGPASTQLTMILDIEGVRR